MHHVGSDGVEHRAELARRVAVPAVAQVPYQLGRQAARIAGLEACVVPPQVAREEAHHVHAVLHFLADAVLRAAGGHHGHVDAGRRQLARQLRRHDLGPADHMGRVEVADQDDAQCVAPERVALRMHGG